MLYLMLASNYLRSLLPTRRDGELGQGLVEYMLVLGVLVVLVFLAIMMTGLQTAITESLNDLLCVFSTGDSC